MQGDRYPWLQIRSRAEFSRHISHTGFSRERALRLIDDVAVSFGGYWKDSKRNSEPEKGKYVRSAKGTRLGFLLEKINRKVLAPHDSKLPGFIFGGLSESSHVLAAQHLLGSRRKRVLLKLDIKRFFEQISEKRVFEFFHYKCGCSQEMAMFLAGLCCVPLGPKGSGSSQKTLARGFATSSRLSVWCNLDMFLKLDRLVKERLKGRDPRIAIYVDDIGITASNVTKEEMDVLFSEINALMVSDPKQPLPLNEEKKKIISHEEGMELLGIHLFRNRLGIGKKTTSKRTRIKQRLQKGLSSDDREHLKRKYKSLSHYKGYVESRGSNT